MIELLPLLAESGAAAVEASGAAAGGPIALGLAGAGAAIGVGLVGMAAATAVGRNPTASGKILTIGILGMAFAEAIAIYALVAAFALGK